jgi:ribonuclease BN (tRNA processing enzyme)
VRLTIVGRSPSWPDAGGACSGYLIEERGYRLLLDCGPGVFAKLRQVIDYLELDAVLISHMHGDHFLDLIPFSYALSYSPRQQHDSVAPWPGTSAPARPALHVPPGGRAALRTLVSAFADADLVETAFAASEYDPGGSLALGPFTIRFAEVPHFVRTHAVDIAGADGTRVTFSADCGPNDALVALARDTDLLLIEATLATGDSEESGGHLTARQAGEHARRARAGQVLLTHVSDEYRPDVVLAAAAATFSGPIELARAGVAYTPEHHVSEGTAAAS